MRASNLTQRLGGADGCRNVQQTQPRRGVRSSLDAVGIGNGLPQHLVSAAQPENPTAAPHVRRQIDVPALRAKKRELGERGLCSRDDNEIARGQRLSRRHHSHVDLRLSTQGIQVVKVGDPGQHGHRDIHAPLSRRRRLLQYDRILSRQSCGGAKPWHQTEVVPAGTRADDAPSLIEERGIPAKLVDDEALDQVSLRIRKQGVSADQAGDHPAPVDAPDDDDGHVTAKSEAHVRDVVGAEVHLCGAAGPFYNDQIGPRAQTQVALADDCRQLPFHRLELGGRDVAPHLAAHDNLRADVRLGLEQHGVHVDAERRPARPSLQRLSAPYLQPFAGDSRVVRHVLRFERQHAETAPSKEPAYAGHEHALAHVGAGAHQHQGGAHDRSLADRGLLRTRPHLVTARHHRKEAWHLRRKP